MTTIVALGCGQRIEVCCSFSTFMRRWRRGLRRGGLVYLRYAPLMYANAHQIVYVEQVA